MLGVKMEKIGECAECSGDIMAMNTGISALEPSPVGAVCGDCKIAQVAKAKDDEKARKKESLDQAIRGYFDNLETDAGVRSGLGIPKRYQCATLATFEGNVSGQVQKWIECASENLLIQSPKAGNGKTHLAIACMVEMLKSMKGSTVKKNLEALDNLGDHKKYKPTAKFENFSEIMMTIKASFNSEGATEQDIVDRYVGYDILVVDDIGAEKITDYTQAVVYSILNKRYEDMKPTIITTNLSSGDITSGYGSRILSRIASGVIISLDGADRRLSRK